MIDLRDNVSRLSDDLARRAKPYARDLLDRAEDLRDRARPYADGLVSKARPYTEDWAARLTDRVHDLSDRAQEISRRVTGRPAPIQEERSFLQSPAAQVASAAALGLLAGLALNGLRKVSVQGAEALNGDWLDIVKAEHQAVDGLFDGLLATTESQKVKRTFLLSRLSHALGKHALQEEMAIYPALKEANGDGRALHLYEDHAQIKMFIHELNDIAKDDPLWIERARAFRDHVERHVREEEDEIYPAFHARMSSQQNKRLTLGLHKEGLKLA